MTRGPASESREGYDTMEEQIKFWYETLAWVRHAEPDSWWTVRHPDEWGHVDPGDRLQLLNEDGEEIGDATVRAVGEFTVHSWCQFDPEGHRSYPRTGALIETLNRAYPDTEWAVDSDVVGLKMDPYTLRPPSNERFHSPPDEVEERRER